MRNAAAVLGIIAGVIGIFVGLFGYGWTSLVAEQPEVGEVLFAFESPGFVRFVSVAGPVMAIAGGAMARIRALWGGLLMLGSAGLMWQGFGFGVATMFPIVMAGLGGLLAVLAGKPDEPKAHF
ncbi:MAG: hypothetical protein CSA74_06590 [Rhodobacterales bacterium]|nr:MAG: hypothetical protein CSA74_06590 [Rhodobacterales bacterium]